MKYLLVTDIPAPWREKVFEYVYRRFGNEFHVVYCNHNEKRRLWKFPLGTHPKTFLRGFTVYKKGFKENYFNFGIIPFLLRHRPRVIVCFSFNPTIYLSFLVARILRGKTVVFADTWLGRDKNISYIQKFARRLACKYFGDAFVGASEQTLAWFKYYNENVAEKSLFLSPLCADNDYFNRSLKGRSIRRQYDIMFSGRIAEEKNPVFFAEVAKKIKTKLGSCKVLVIGDGDDDQKEKLFRSFEEAGIDYYFPGFIEHKDLPEYYSQAKVLLLPTSGDCWGVVINEALVSGVPVITTDMTAAAGELVIDGKNGYVLPLNSVLWAEKITELLKDTKKFEEFSKCAKEKVKKYNFEQASEGIIAAIEYLTGR